MPMGKYERCIQNTTKCARCQSERPDFLPVKSGAAVLWKIRRKHTRQRMHITWNKNRPDFMPDTCRHTAAHRISART